MLPLEERWLDDELAAITQQVFSFILLPRLMERPPHRVWSRDALVDPPCA